MTRALPDKEFFRIGEVARLVGVKPHVLRYWETEFAALRPRKTRGAHRHYARKDVELARLIKQLLHDEGFTVPGARKRLRELGHHTRGAPPPAEASREVTLRAELLAIREELVNLLDAIDAEDDKPKTPPVQVKVTGVAPGRPTTAVHVTSTRRRER